MYAAAQRGHAPPKAGVLYADGAFRVKKGAGITCEAGMKKPPASRGASSFSLSRACQMPRSNIALRTHLVASLSSGATMIVTNALSGGLWKIVVSSPNWALM